MTCYARHSGDGCPPAEPLWWHGRKLTSKMVESSESAIFLNRMCNPEGTGTHTHTQSTLALILSCAHSHGPSKVMVCVQWQAGRVLPCLAAITISLL